MRARCRTTVHLRNRAAPCMVDGDLDIHHGAVCTVLTLEQILATGIESIVAEFMQVRIRADPLGGLVSREARDRDGRQAGNFHHPKAI